MSKLDKKVLDVLSAYGAEGIGIFYFASCQLEDAGGCLHDRDVKNIAYALHVSERKVLSVLCDFGLFTANGDCIVSESYNARVEKLCKVSAERRKAAMARWAKEKKITAPRQRCEWREVKDAWNDTCVSFPKLTAMSDARKNKLRLRLGEMGGLEKCKEIFKRMEASSFLRGENRSGWRATFDWLMSNSTNWVKVSEGNYDDNNRTGAAENGYAVRAAEAASLIAEMRKGSILGGEQEEY